MEDHTKHAPNGAEKLKPQPAARATEKECAYAVMDGANAPPPATQTGELYFYRPDGYRGTVPKEQEDAKQRLEEVCTVLRVVFEKKYPDDFNKCFKKLLLTAQSIFDPVGFRPQPLNDLDRFQREITQAAGGKIKAQYVQRMGMASLIASVLIIVGTLIISLTAIQLKKSGIIVTSEQPANLAEKTVSGKVESVPKTQQEIPNVFRWEGGYAIGHMGVLLACSMWGLFLAAISRNFEPSFDKLIMSDADLMPPWSRLLFFGIVIFGIATILHKKLITVAIGDIFSTAEISKDVVTAGLIGLFLGISERALPKELESWAGGFLSKIQNARETS